MLKKLAALSLALIMALALALPAFAQGNDISCPEGSAANAAGTQCTDLTTGLEVAPISQTVVYPETPNTNPCPEQWVMTEAGICVDPAQQQVVVDPPPPAQPEGAALPATGGVSPVLASLVLASLAVLGSVALIWRR